MRNQRKLRNYLINRKLQISITIKFIFFALVSSTLTGGAVFYTLWTPLARLIPPDIFPILQQNFVFILFWDFVVILCLIFSAGILITHRIAGPLYHIEMRLDKALQDDEIVLIHLRTGGELQTLADKINTLLQKQKDTEQSRDELQELNNDMNTLLQTHKGSKIIDATTEGLS